MPVTWHWGEPGKVAHAQSPDSMKGVALCGAHLTVPALMRPPFIEIRCAACETLRGSAAEWLPNKFKPAGREKWFLTHAPEYDPDLPEELNYLRLDLSVLRSIDPEGFVPFVQIVRDERKRWPSILVDPVDLPPMPTENLAIDLATVMIWSFLDQFPETSNVLI